MPTATERGLDIVKGFESLRLRAYLCPAGVPTIGYGHTAGVKIGDTCSREQAEEWLDRLGLRLGRSRVGVEARRLSSDCILCLPWSVESYFPYQTWSSRREKFFFEQIPHPHWA